MNKDPIQRILHLEKMLKMHGEDFWMRRGRKSALRQYGRMIKVPAYKRLIAKYTKSKLIDWKIFQSLPIISKENYLKNNKYNELFENGKFTSESRVIASTSGSSGKPFYFPRTEEQDKQYQVTAELYLRTNFFIHKRTTLYIDAFPMGPWIGGLFTYEAVTRIARNGNYPLSIITTSINPDEIIKVIQELGDSYDQIIIGSYAPFLKDTLDYGKRRGVDWKKFNIKFIFSAEAFPESFRDYLVQETGLTDIYFETLNHYGTVDLGTMSYETPISILIRRLSLENPKLFYALFGNTNGREPTLTQYIPEMFFFELVNDHLVCTSNSAIPLVRYDLLDRGGLISFENVVEICKGFNIDLFEEARKIRIENSIWRLPFVYVLERDDFSVSYYAFQVYPGPIKKLFLEKKIQKFVTGKFTLESIYDRKGKPRLLVNVELKEDVKGGELVKQLIRKSVHNLLIKCNSQYKETIERIGSQAFVDVKLWPYKSASYFKQGTKQKWVKKG